MAEKWVRTADGHELKAEAKNVRAASGFFSLGMVPIIADVLITPAGSPIAPDDRLNISASPINGAVVGDPVFICPKASGDDVSPGNEMYGLTIGPVCIDVDGNVRIYLQNRTAAPISVLANFFVRVCVLHLLPEPPT
jgi:hypothetical protein